MAGGQLGQYQRSVLGDRQPFDTVQLSLAGNVVIYREGQLQAPCRVLDDYLPGRRGAQVDVVGRIDDSLARPCAQTGMHSPDELDDFLPRPGHQACGCVSGCGIATTVRLVIPW